MKRVAFLLAYLAALMAAPAAVAAHDAGGVGGTAWVNTGVSCGPGLTFWHNVITGAWICWG